MKDKSYYKSLPLNLKRSLRKKQEKKVYQKFIREITKFSFDEQVDIESEYLRLENQLLVKKLTNDDRDIIQVPPECFKFLGDLAEKLPERLREQLSIMPYEQLMQGAEYYRQHPPRRKACQCDFNVEHLVVNIANQNITWSAGHILKAVHDLGFAELTISQIEKILHKNKIPNSTNRTRQGIAWRDFLANLKNDKLKGVIIQ